MTTAAQRLEAGRVVKEPITRMRIWKMGQEHGWPALSFATASNSRWEIEAGREVWEGVLLRSWTGLLEAIAQAIERSN